ncbi:MAG: LysM peptidoglycan-binding domain-containing protein [Schleiferiaceae bacterium]|nr:LysM peptidoglycan-binding domain-containing protein [Schleiferiaceae bacterium]
MNKIFLFVLLFFTACLVTAQSGDYRYHTVEPGETLYGLSRKYNVSIDALLGANPQVADGLNVGVVVLIPNNSSVAGAIAVTQQPDSSDAQYIYHRVLAKETLYGISKKYDLPIETIESDNPELAERGLQIGQVIRIAKARASQEPFAVSGEVPIGDFVIRVVQAGETVYSITREAKLLADEFFQLNPHTVDGLKEGQEIRLPATAAARQAMKEDSKVEPPTEQKEPAKDSDYKLYQVKADDSMEALLRKYRISQADLLEVNPELKDGLISGRYIIIPLKKSTLAKPAPVKVEEKEFTLAEKSSPSLVGSMGKKGQRSVAVLLPFKAGTEKEVVEELESDDETDQSPKRQRVKRRERDAQMSLEFYTGFTLAMDTLVTQGYQLQVKVIDTKADAKTVAREATTIQAIKPDVVVGPLYAKHATTLAKQLEKDNIFVFSPLSRGVDNSENNNLVAVIPSKEHEYEKVAKYLNTHADHINVIFVNTDNPQSRAAVKTIRSRMFASENTSVKEIWLSRASGLSSHLHPTRENIFVVVDQQQAFLTDLVSKLYALRNSNIRLLSTTDLIGVETIEVRYLNAMRYTCTDLFFIDYSSAAVIQFVKAYRERYQTEPSRAAFQGFDMGLYAIAIFENNGKVSYLPPKSGLATGYNFRRSTVASGPSNDHVFLVEMKDFLLRPVSEAPRLP